MLTFPVRFVALYYSQHKIPLIAPGAAYRGGEGAQHLETTQTRTSRPVSCQRVAEALALSPCQLPFPTLRVRGGTEELPRPSPTAHLWLDLLGLEPGEAGGDGGDDANAHEGDQDGCQREHNVGAKVF